MRYRDISDHDFRLAVREFYASARSWDVIDEIADQFFSKTGHPLHLSLIVSRSEDEIGLLGQLAHFIDNSSASDGYAFLRFQADRLASGALLQYPGTDVWIFITPEETKLFRNTIEKISRLSFPWAWRPNFSSAALSKIITSAANSTPISSVRVLECVTRSIIPNYSGSKSVRSERVWTDEIAINVFQRVHDEGKWFSSVHCSLFNDDLDIAHFSLNRLGEIGVFNNFKMIEQTIIGPACHYAVSEADFLRNRSKENSTSKNSSPIVIQYDEAVFEDKGQNKRLINVLQSFPKSSVSIIHGNPYVRASLTDYRDGSGYAIWVLSTNRILIRPKTRSTPASFGALCNHICDEFKEGTISNYTLGNQ